MASEVKVKVSLQSGVATGLTKVKAQFAQFRRDLNSQFANFFAFGAIAAGIGSIIEKGDQLANVAHRFGAPIEELQRVAIAAKENGASIEDVARAWNKLTVSKEKAIAGNDEARKSFENLGISMEDVARLPVVELFHRIADATKDAADHDKAYAAVFALMGKGAGTLFSTLEKGAAGIKAMSNESEILSAKSVEAIHQLSVEFDHA